MLLFPSEFLPKDLPTHSFPKPTKICFWKPILILPLHAFFGIINFIVLWLVYTLHLCLNQEVLTDKLNNMQNSLSALISSTVWNHKWLFSVPFRNLLGSLSPVRGPCVCLCKGGGWEGKVVPYLPTMGLLSFSWRNTCPDRTTDRTLDLGGCHDQMEQSSSPIPSTGGIREWGSRPASSSGAGREQRWGICEL